jgi:hypothetical protein
MGKKTQKDEESPRELEDLERQVYEAFLRRGWIIPQTEADVSRAEAETKGECGELPAELKNPQAVLRRAVKTREQVVPLQLAEDAEDTPLQMARAARAGKDIPPEVEERMRRDREASEQEASDDR